jgi:hypothetical protein
VVEAYAETYDDVDFDDVVTPRNQVFMRELASRCLGGREILLTLGQVSVLGTDVWNGNPMSGTLGPRIQENVPLAPIEVPLLIGQGLDDQLVLPSAQEAYVAQRCELGTTLDFRTYEGRDHVPLVEEDSPLVPELIQWTEDRLNGVAASTTC